MRPMILTVFLFLLSAPASLHSEEDPGFISNMLHSVIINVGISGVNDSLKVSDDTLGGQGELTEEHGSRLSISIGLKNSYIGESNWGHSVSLGWSRFDMNQQKVGNNIVDLGTSAEGDIWFIVPTLFYMFGAQHYDGWYFKPGIGIGIGRISASGDIILTNAAGNPRTDFNIRSDPLSLSYSIYLETGYKNWFLRMSSSGPVTEENDREFEGSRTAVTLGYAWVLFP